MKQLAIINLNNISSDQAKNFRQRQASRAIIFDHEKKIALMHVSINNYHKLPGGGIEAGEDKIAALKRECLEEAGCQIEVTGEVGSILEYKDQWQLAQESYCYLVKVIGEKGQPTFTGEELTNEFKLLWVDLATAIALIKADKPKIYEGRIVNARDLTFLLTAEKILNFPPHPAEIELKLPLPRRGEGN